MFSIRQLSVGKESVEGGSSKEGSSSSSLDYSLNLPSSSNALCSPSPAPGLMTPLAGHPTGSPRPAAPSLPDAKDTNLLQENTREEKVEVYLDQTTNVIPFVTSFNCIIYTVCRYLICCRYTKS